MKKRLLLIIGFFISFVAPTSAMAAMAKDFNWIYFHYENSKLSDYYSFLEKINDVFETYFTFKVYISIVIFAYVVIAIILTIEVLRGKSIMLFWDKFFYKSLGDNIIVRIAIIIAGYFIFLFPVPVVQVAPIVSYANIVGNDGVLTVKGWLIDKENSEIGADGSQKLLHVPMALGIPLGLIERYVYGFPVGALSSNIQLDWDSSTKRHKLISVTDAANFQKVTDETGACPITSNAVDASAITACEAAMANFAPNSMSLLGNTLAESAEIFVNVAAPFKKFESLLNFQRNFLNSIVVEQDALALTDKVKKNNKILNAYLAGGTTASDKYLQAIEELYTQRVKEINTLLKTEFAKFDTLYNLTRTFPDFSGYLRIYGEQLLLEKLGRVYSANVFSSRILTQSAAEKNRLGTKPFTVEYPIQGSNTSISTPPITMLQSAVESRNALVRNLSSNDKLKNKKVFNLNQELTANMTEFNTKFTEIANNKGVRPTGDFIHNKEFEVEPRDKMNFDASPFIIDPVNFKFTFDITKMQSIGQTGNRQSNMMYRFWENYKDKIFNNLAMALDNKTSLDYYKPDLVSKILTNLGIKVKKEDGSQNIDLRMMTENLIKFDKLTANLFVLDILYAYLKTKVREANNNFYNIFDEDLSKIITLSSTAFQEKYQDKVVAKINDWKTNKKMVMGLLHDDFSYKSSEYNQRILIRVNGGDIVYTDEAGTYTAGGSLFQKKNRNSILSFICESGTQDVNTDGICLLEIDSNGITINKGSLKYLNSQQNHLFLEIRSAIELKRKGVTNYEEQIKVENKSVVNPCLTDLKSMDCAKFEAQEALKKASSSMMDAITSADITTSNFDDLTAVLFVYAGLLRSFNYEVITQLATNGKKINPDNPLCSNSTSSTNKDLTVSGAEAYNNIKNVMEQAMAGTSNYISSQISLVVSALGALSKEQLKIGAGSSWSSPSNPQIEFSDDYVNKVKDSMIQSIEDEDGTTTAGTNGPGTGTCNVNSQSNDKAKALCQIWQDFSATSSAGASDNKFQTQISQIVRFLATKSAIAPVDTSLLTKTFKIYADTIGSFYNRNVLVFNEETFIGISKLTGVFQTTMGGNFSSQDNRTYDYSKFALSPESFKEKITITSEVCESPSLKIEEQKQIANNKIGDSIEQVSDWISNNTGIGFIEIIFATIIMFLITLYAIAALMIPFLYILVFSIITTIIGWLGAVSVAYILVLNLLVLRNLDDIDMIKTGWVDPSKKMLEYFAKAIISSMLLYVYLVATVFLISGILVPLGETITMYYILNAIVESEGISLSIWFNTVTFILTTIFFVYMKFSLRMVKDWFASNITSPASEAIKHAQKFVQRLNK